MRHLAFHENELIADSEKAVIYSDLKPFTYVYLVDRGKWYATKPEGRVHFAPSPTVPKIYRAMVLLAQ